MKRAGSALGEVIRDLGLENALRLYRVRERWNVLFDGPLGLHTYADSINEGNLLVNVNSSAWLQQTNFLKDRILEKLEPLGVMEIRFRLGKVRPRPDRPKPAINALSEKDAGFIKDVVSGIGDAALGDTVRAAMEGQARRGGFAP